MTLPAGARPDEPPGVPGERAEVTRRLPGPSWMLAALCLALLAFQAYVIFVQPHGLAVSSARDVRPVGEIAGAVAVRQTLVTRANGLDAITLHVRASGTEHEGPVILELGEAGDDPAGDADRPVYRSLVETRRVVDDSTFTWRFAPIESSSGKRYALKVTMPAAPFGHGLTLLATRDERYRDGRLWFDGREQWGDLLFETSAVRATAFRRLEHALRDKPAWLRSRVTLAALFVVYNAALAVILWTLLTAPIPGQEPGQAVAPATRWMQPGARRYRILVLAGLVTVAALAAWWAVPRRVPIERGARELISEFPETAKRTTMPSLQDGFVYEDVWWNDRRMKCIVALPFSRISWSVDAMPNTVLRGWYGLRQDVWDGPGDGAQFRVGVADAESYHESARRWLHPDVEPRDRVFVPVRVDLSPYAGRRVNIVLNTEPGPMGNAVGDAAMWCEMRIVER